MRPANGKRKDGMRNALKITPDNLLYFPHANEVLRPLNRFFIGGKWLNLYIVEGRTQSAPFSLYWQDEHNPAQHAMTSLEVFAVLADLLKPFVHFIKFGQKFGIRWVCHTPKCYKLTRVRGLSPDEVKRVNIPEEKYSYFLLPGQARVISKKITKCILDKGLGTPICEDCRKEL